MSFDRRVIAVLGAQFGDEGKGHVVHSWAPEFDWVVRFSGGANAGHTIYRDGKRYVHNHLPSADLRHSRTRMFLGSGMVIDPDRLLDEIKTTMSDFPDFADRIYVDPDTFVVTPEHKRIDGLKNHVGTTGRGIGPAYMSKFSRSGNPYKIRNYLVSRESESVNELLRLGVNFTPVLELKSEFERTRVIFEGAQGVMLDINHGTYPYVSNGDCTLGGIHASGFGFLKIDKVYGVAKCYLTRVGHGPFPTEVFGETEKSLRESGGEWGATTGRPRRVGWLDLPMLEYACVRGAIDALVMTKFDILNGRNDVKIATTYDTASVRSASEIEAARPKYVSAPLWSDARNELGKVKEFLNIVESRVRVPVQQVTFGVGPSDFTAFPEI